MLLTALLLMACGTGPQSHGGPVQDRVSLIDTLRAKGVTVEPTGSVAQPFLHAQSGTILRVSGPTLATPTDIQAYEYASAGAASADAALMRSDGSGTATTHVDWVAPPHFFLKGRVIVVFVGSDPAALALLRSILGTQIAGR